MSEKKGTYLLFLSIQQGIHLQIGALGLIHFESGNFIYIGSAMGPGGLMKRISRHLKQVKKIFWHIDYLLNHDYVKIKAYGKIYSSKKMECNLAQKIKELFNNRFSNVKNFGSSDCNCESHLLYIEEQSIKKIINRLEGEMGNKYLEITYL